MPTKKKRRLSVPPKPSRQFLKSKIPKKFPHKTFPKLKPIPNPTQQKQNKKKQLQLPQPQSPNQPPQPHPNPQTSSSNSPSYWKTSPRLGAIWWFHVVRVQTWNQGFYHIAATTKGGGGVIHHRLDVSPKPIVNNGNKLPTWTVEGGYESINCWRLLYSLFTFLEEVVHHLGCKKTLVNNGIKLPTNWCRKTSMDSMTVLYYLFILELNYPQLRVKQLKSYSIKYRLFLKNGIPIRSDFIIPTTNSLLSKSSNCIFSY